MSTQQNPASPRLHLRIYLVCPNEDYRSVKSLLTNFDKLVAPYKEDTTGIVININSEDKYAKAFIEDYIKQYEVSGITIKENEPDFAKHKKLAYVKRNHRCILRASHILLISGERLTIGQEYINRQVEDLDKFLLVWKVTAKKEKSDGEK